jgi:REP element-mobilizing transposase RayT
MIAGNHGFQLLAARVHDGDHVHLFVSALPTTCIPEMVRAFKCVSAQLLFEKFPWIKAHLWDGVGWAGLGWDGLGWAGMGWDGMGWPSVV